MAACSGEDADDKIDCRPAYYRVQNDSLGALAAHFCNLVGRGEGGCFTWNSLSAAQS